MFSSSIHVLNFCISVTHQNVLYVLIFPIFYKAQAKLGQLRVEANRIKSGLERKIQVHKTAVKRAKTILKHMQVGGTYRNSHVSYFDSGMVLPYPLHTY